MTRPFRVVVAPDKFKGSLRADEVSATISEVLAGRPGVEVVQHPVADGGEGTVDLALARGFRPVTVRVTGPLGEAVDATYAERGQEAVIEMAAAAGLALLPTPPDPRTAWDARTHGVGELILAAVNRGATRVVVGAGGSASTDGGVGALAALGCELQNPTGPLKSLAGVALVVACDVDNPLLGPNGAAAVYAPQKGADARAVIALECRLEQWADEVAAASGHDIRSLPGVGAAGGLAYGLVAVAGARLVSGAELMLQLTGFDAVAETADLVIVGEGSLDRQSLHGKGPISLARAASARGTSVVAVAGRCELSPLEQRQAGLRGVYCLTDVEPDPTRCIREARRLLPSLVTQLAADWLPNDSHTASTRPSTTAKPRK